MKYLAPSILSADFSNLSQQIRYVEMGGADIIHCDVMDGNFVPNISFGADVVKTVSSITKLPLDVHLMVKNPQHHIENFAEAGANYISVHAEAVLHLDRMLNSIKELNIKSGLALNPSTPIDSIKPVLEIVDYILIMTVNPGFGGQKFIEYTKKKIKELSDLRDKLNLQFLIEVDGGVDKNNILDLSELGVDIFVVGSAIYKSDNITAATLELINFIK